MANWLEHTVQIEVDAPIEIVWGMWSDLEQMPRWNPGYQGIWPVRVRVIIPIKIRIE